MCAAMTIAAIALSQPVPSSAAQEGNSAPHWDATYHAGAAPFRSESRIVVAIEDDRLFLRMKKKPQFVIPVRDITAVSSNVTGHYGRVTAAEAKFMDSVAEKCGPGPDVVCGSVVLGTWLMLLPSYPIKTTDRLVRIVWRDKNTDQEIVLMFRKDAFGPFLAQLEKATAKPWKNVDAEWAKVQQDLKNAEPNKVGIRLDRKVRVAKSDLERGTYQLVLLDREPNRGELYFFPGDEVDPERLAAVASVEIEPSVDKIGVPQVDYKEEAHGKSMILTIRISSKTFRFP